MAQNSNPTSSELLQSYNRFISELVGARLATKLSANPQAVLAGAGAMMAIGGLPAAATILGPALAYLTKRLTESGSPNISEKQPPEHGQLTVEEIVEDIKQCIASSDNIVYFSTYRNKTQKKKIDIPLELESEIQQFVSDIATSNALDEADALLPNTLMEKFADKIKKKQEEAARKTSLSKAEAESASERFRIFLERQGLDKANAAHVAALHATFVQTELPELSVLAAVQDLRDQFYREPVNLKRPYLGKTKETEFPDPKEFLIHYYGTDIAKGSLTTGRLQEIDPLLYKSLYRDLEGTPVTIGEIVEPRGKPTSQKVTTCAAILGQVSLEDAARFLGGMRVDRLGRQTEEGGRREKEASITMG